ncbi:4Fe-4S dicluster domain-containing protein [Arabiibacter massiliensis]|uniref:4Fe-4S dicluster domain-containing protein n=1 Tax=Arabiibacter massiliensis TaxID=1870985 RepID=UPI0009B9B503|nr:4Fe-4S dicluster domain-containing protein [Arabiibacter massiliensis]
MGNKFVIADPGVCIGCKTCMAACLSKHDVCDDVAQARLNLVTTLNVSAPIVCHHCADAPCAAACPTGALYLDAEHNRVGVRAERCIGCSGCVMACPYGAVTIATRHVVTKLGSLVIGESDKPVVIKCDLCVDRPEGPACVQACPTKGLVLVDEDVLEAGIKQKNRAAAEAAESISSLPLNPVLA